MKSKLNDTAKYLKELIGGNLSTKCYNYLFAYTKNVLKKHTSNLPPHLELDDIVAQSIAQAYLMRDQYDQTKAYEVTWYLNIAINYSKQTYNKYNNINSIKHIPNKSMASNIIRNEDGNEVSIFDTLQLVDEIDLDNILSDSKDVSEVVRQFILENNLDVLYARLYEEPIGETLNGISRQYGLMTYEELAKKFNTTHNVITNTIYQQKLVVINHFKKIKKEKTIKDVAQQRKEYYEKNKKKILERQKEYYEKNKEKLQEYRKDYYKEYNKNKNK